MWGHRGEIAKGPHSAFSVVSVSSVVGLFLVLLQSTAPFSGVELWIHKSTSPWTTSLHRWERST